MGVNNDAGISSSNTLNGPSSTAPFSATSALPPASTPASTTSYFPNYPQSSSSTAGGGIEYLTEPTSVSAAGPSKRGHGISHEQQHNPFGYGYGQAQGYDMRGAQAANGYIPNMNEQTSSTAGGSVPTFRNRGQVHMDSVSTGNTAGPSSGYGYMTTSDTSRAGGSGGSQGVLGIPGAIGGAGAANLGMYAGMAPDTMAEERPSLSRGGISESGRRGGNPEWKYEMRREAQEIVPGLFLGPFQSSLNLNKMKVMGITHILCIRDQKEARLIYPRFPTEFKYMTLDISDTTDQNLITIFPRCRDFIEEAMSMGGTVLAHCNGGIALSPAIVVGYLMWKYDWSAEYATAFVQNKRYCVSTMSFQNQFKEYEPIQLAQKMVSLAGGITVNSGHKRQAMEEDDDDEDERRRQVPRSDSIDISMG